MVSSILRTGLRQDFRLGVAMDMSFEERVRFLLQDIYFLIATRGLPPDPAWKNYNIVQRLRRIVEDMAKSESKE